MKILSWNVNMYSGKSGYDLISRGEIILNSIKQIKPDILILQENSDLFNEDIYTYIDNIRTSYSIKTHCGLLSIYFMNDGTTGFDGHEWYTDIQSGLDNAGSYISVQIGDMLLVACHLLSGQKYEKYRNEFFNLFDSVNTMIIGDVNHSGKISTKYIDDIITVNTWSEKFFSPNSNRECRYDRVITDIECSVNVLQEYYGQSDHLPICAEVDPHNPVLKLFTII